MYRVLLIDVMSGQGFRSDPPQVVCETEDEANALQVLKMYQEKYKWHKVVLQQAIPTITWKTIEI